MVAILKKHKITYDEGGTSKSYIFLANPKTYQGIGTDTNVTEANDAEQGEAETSVSAILGAGYVIRVNIYYKVGTIRRIATILIPSSKFVNFRKKMPGKQYNGGTVVSVKQPRRAYSY